MPPKYPGAIDDEYSLLTAVDNAQSILSADIAIDSTSIYIADASNFPQEGFATIHNKQFTIWEKFYYSNKNGNSFIDLIRTDPKGWTACNECQYVSLLMTEEYHNWTRDVIIELEKRVDSLDSTSSAVVVIDDGTGLAKFQDGLRADKWVSVDRQTLTFSRNRRKIQSRYLEFANIPSSIHSLSLMRNSTITAISVMSENPRDAWFRIRKNGSPTNIHSIQLSGVNSRIRDNITIDLTKGDYLQVYLEVISGDVDFPVMVIEYAHLF